MKTRTNASTLLVLALAGAAAPTASADVVTTAFFSNKASYKLAGNAGNADATVNFGSGGGNIYRLLISGTLHRNTQGTFPREALVRFRRLVHLAPNISILTHDFIAQPFTGTTWDANGNATVNDALVLPVPEDKVFGNAFSWCSMSEPGHWDIEFCEQYDDNAADSGPTPDATWISMSVKFDSTPPSLATAVPVSGAVGTTTRYGVRSNDNLDPGPFTGSQIDPLAKPAGGTRIKHVRVTGYISMGAFSTAAEQAGPNECGQARLRLRRYESVQLSPNDNAPFSTSDDLFVELPFATSSTGYICMDIPVAANDDFGKLTRNVPTSENESYYGIKYFATAFEDDDHTQFPVDNVWNGLKIELFSEAQPSNAIDLGLLDASPNGAETHRIAPGTIQGGKPLWYRFELPGMVSAAAGTFLDIDTEQTVPGTFDTMIGLYGGEPALQRS